MPFVPDWAAFLEYFETMRGYGIVEGMKDFYWDIPPSPIRHHRDPRLRHAAYGAPRGAACGLCAGARRLAARGAHALAVAALQVNAFNRFEPCVSASWASSSSLRAQADIGDDFLDTAATVMPHAARLGSATEAVRALAHDVRRGYSDAGWLRSERLDASGSLAGRGARGQRAMARS